MQTNFTYNLLPDLLNQPCTLDKMTTIFQKVQAHIFQKYSLQQIILFVNLKPFIFFCVFSLSTYEPHKKRTDYLLHKEVL